MARASTGTSRASGFFRRVAQFFGDSWTELKKVAWPSRAEVWRFTVVVLFAVATIAVFIYACDKVLTVVTRPLFR